VNRVRKLSYLFGALFVLLQIQGCTHIKNLNKPANCGHKGGYDCMKELPENSLALLEHLEVQQRHPRFKYLEFDVRETKDEKLVVFHDATIRRMLPDKGYNKAVYKTLRSSDYNGKPNELSKKPSFFWRVSDLTLEQIQSLSLEGRLPQPAKPKRFQVPTLKKYIRKFSKNVTKPVVFEIKKLNTTKGRKDFKQAVIDYTNSIGGNRPSGTRYNSFPYQQVSIINLTSLQNNFEKIQPVCEEFKTHSVNIYRGWTHDSLCDFFYVNAKKYTHFRLLRANVENILKRVAVKHPIRQIESELDPANYHEPRLVHYEPSSKVSAARFVYSPIEQADAVLKRLNAINSDKLIVFVHGRGQHPEKGEEMAAELASEHKAGVLMFNWDSWICKSYCEETIKDFSSKYPLGNAIAAAPELVKLMQSLHGLKENNSKIKISMLVHSMGNIVFKEMMEDYAFRIPRDDVFIDNLILNSADVDGINHQYWLDNILFVEDLFVTMTSDDFALGAVELMLFRPRLGQGVVTEEDSKDSKKLEDSETLAANAHYIDFSNVGSSHRKFGEHKFRKFFKSAFGEASWMNCQKGLSVPMKDFDYNCVEMPNN